MFNFDREHRIFRRLWRRDKDFRMYIRERTYARTANDHIFVDRENPADIVQIMSLLAFFWERE
jgi:hypothetical protein